MAVGVGASFGACSDDAAHGSVDAADAATATGADGDAASRPDTPTP
ncbi:MAG: hypothetical protein U1F43_23040 [Myxococcota bacterium]